MSREKVDRENEWGSCPGGFNKDGDCTDECDSGKSGSRCLFLFIIKITLFFDQFENILHSALI